MQPSFDAYPEHVPESGPGAGKYEAKPARFWTCGFFPSSLYCILERYTKFPNRTPFSALPSDNISSPDSSYRAQLLALCRAWAAPLRVQASRTDTHDLGFMMHPLRMDWELTGDSSSLKDYIIAANSLASRFDERVGAIRSWDKIKRLNFEVHDKENNFLIIVDSMCSTYPFSPSNPCTPFLKPELDHRLTTHDWCQTWTCSSIPLITATTHASLP